MDMWNLIIESNMWSLQPQEVSVQWGLQPGIWLVPVKALYWAAFWFPWVAVLSPSEALGLVCRSSVLTTAESNSRILLYIWKWAPGVLVQTKECILFDVWLLNSNSLQAGTDKRPRGICCLQIPSLHISSATWKNSSFSVHLIVALLLADSQSSCTSWGPQKNAFVYSFVNGRWPRSGLKSARLVNGAGALVAGK